MSKCFSLFGVNIQTFAKKEVVKIISNNIKMNKKTVVSTPNTEIVMMCKKNEHFKTMINSSDLVIPDGIGVVWAGRYLGVNVPERVTGYDVLVDLLDLSSKENFSLYFFGAAEKTLKKAVENVKSKYPNINIVGFKNGYFDDNEIDKIINDINEKTPDILFVALGAPKQEEWIFTNKEKLNCKIFFGVGGSFDVLSGNTKRAPLFMQKLGLEWFYRLYKEPKRISRMFVIPIFMFLVLFHKKN